LFIWASTGLGCLSAALIVAQAWLLATVIADAFAGKSLAQARDSIVALLIVVLARAAVAWGAQVLAARSSTRAKAQLRDALLSHLVTIGPGRIGQERSGEIAALATRGVDALDAYFADYLPQLLLAFIVPCAVLVAVLASDWISAAIIALTLPLIPLFMALVGATTRDRTRLQLSALQRLAGHFLDVVSGLATLKVFGAAKRQISVIGEISERHRVTAMATLRVTFLSSLILELVATISVALVAVAVGLRLLNGDLGLRSAMFVLVLAPEAYLPLRALGANYHASAEGISAAEQAFVVLETPPPPGGGRTEIPDLSTAALTIGELTVEYPGRDEPALDRLSLRIEPGETLAVTGRSGSGKSTLLSVLLRFTEPVGGSVRVGDSELADLAPDAWRGRLSWLPQRPTLFAGSIAENLRLARPQATDRELWQALTQARLNELIAARPDGLDARIGEGGAGLSAGERQRLALARVFLRDTPLVLLDEPTAGLDFATEREVLAAIQQLIRGRTVILVAHRPALVALADRVVDLSRTAVPA
jgi:thiol reductant ABC exporter CydD subunit